MRKHLLFYLISLFSLLFFVLLQLLDPAALREQIESKTFDLRLNLRTMVKPQSAAKNIAIVVIDEKSIAEIGRWPWSRTVQAELIDKIASGKPKAIGIDIMFSEKESEAADQRLAEAIRNAGNVVQGVAFFSGNGVNPKEMQSPDYLWDAAFMEVKSVPGIDWKSWAVKPDSVNLPVEPIARAATLGHVTNIPEMDGVLRQELLYLNYGDDCYPSMPLQLARLYKGLPPQKLTLYGGSGIQLGDTLIKTDISGRVIINYLGREKTFQHIPAADILKGRISTETLKGKIVLVGTSALATFDQKVTPFSANYPGVEKNATVVQNILDNDFITRSHGIIELVVIIVSSLLLIILLPRLKALTVGLLGSTLIITYLAMATWLLINHNLWIYTVIPSANMLLILIAGSVTRLFTEEKKAKEIRAMFSSYITERLVNEMVKNPEMARLGGEKREITVLFSDVKGFTTYSENHAPEEVVAILNEYLGEMTRIILKWEGILDKFIGDAIVVFWGAPMAQEDHAERAVMCALEMQQRLQELKTIWETNGREPLSSGIGINTGEAIVGNIGAEGQKMDYTVIGDHVNLGARVEGLTRRYDASILVTEYTVDRLRTAITEGSLRGLAITGVERVIVKGKETPVGIFSVTAASPGSKALLTECDPDKIVKLTEK